MKKEVIEVRGMMCSHCEGRVNDALSSVDGVKSVKADAKKAKVTVKFDEEKTSLSELKEKIKAVGYEVL